MISLDLAAAPYAALLCTVVFIYLLWKHPCGAPFYSYTVIGLGWVPIIGEFRYATFITGMQAIGIAYLWIKSFHHGQTLNAIFKIFTGAGSLLIWILLFVWIKIAIDLSFSGIGKYQLDAIKTGVYLVAEPVLIFILAVSTRDLRKVVSDVLIGLLVLTAAYILPTLPALVFEDRLQLAVLGIQRLTIYNLDTINSARFLFFGAIGLLGLIITSNEDSKWQVVLWIIFAALTTLLLLNTTRQFIFTLSIAGVVVLPQILRQRGGQIVLTLIAIIGIGIVVVTLMRREEVKERLTADQIQYELQMQRGEIWTSALLAGIESPILGNGFRKFGNLTYVYDPTTGYAEESMSNAHGVFQDVFAEEGAVLGFLLIAAYIYSIYRSIKIGWILRSNLEFRYFTIVINALVIPTLFSGAIYESMSLHMFAVAMSLMVRRLSSNNIVNKQFRITNKNADANTHA